MNRTRHRDTRVALGALSLLAAGFLVFASCARVETEAEPVKRRVVILGIDGLEWDIMGPLLESGRLPNFAKLVHEGAWGELRSLKFLESPMIWTTIATGKLPGKHGITGFTTKDGAARSGAIITADFRTARTVWDILGERDFRVGVVGWLVTWPAEPVNGYLVTDRFGYGWDAGSRSAEGITFPADLLDEIGALRVRPEDVSDREVERFLRGGVPAGGEISERVQALRRLIATDATSLAAARYLFAERPSDFSALYLKGADGVCHQFWTDAFPESGPAPSEREIEVFGEVITRYYEYSDEIVGEFLNAVDENTTLIVTSDHGHSGPKPRGDSYAWGIAMHDPTGFFALYGRDILGGQEIANASVLDITPTILALCGLPVAEDMDGKVLERAIDPDFLSRHPVASVASYESDASVGGAGESEESIESPLDEEILEELRSLGYID
jgi:predicted AlkP superfamily phosphohydrolase/phosphomutase